jgi:hypothetical protein
MTGVAPGALAIPFEILAPTLEQFAFNGQIVRIMQHEQDFHDLQFRYQQISFENQFGLNQIGTELLIGQLERAFDSARKTVRRDLTNGLDAPKLRDRHNSFPEDNEAQIFTWIQHQAKKSTGDRKRHSSLCTENFGKSIPGGWVDSFLSCNLTLLIEATSTPHENSRLQVPRGFLEETLCCMEQAVQGVVRDLVFNLDEVGVSEWEDPIP